MERRLSTSSSSSRMAGKTNQTDSRRINKTDDVDSKRAGLRGAPIAFRLSASDAPPGPSPFPLVLRRLLGVSSAIAFLESRIAAWDQRDQFNVCLLDERLVDQPLEVLLVEVTGHHHVHQDLSEDNGEEVFLRVAEVASAGGTAPPIGAHRA
jgi:hypothetical protein